MKPTHPPLRFKYDHRLSDDLPCLDLYDGLELVMSQKGCQSLSVFLTPASALYLAEKLIELARKRIEAKQ